LNGSLDALVASGLAELWSADREGHPLEGGPYAALTPLAAEQLGLALHEPLELGAPHWVPADLVYRRRRPIRLVYYRFEGTRRLRWPELVVDPRPGPLEQLIDQETGKAMVLCGAPVYVDPRLTPKRTKRRTRSGPAHTSGKGRVPRSPGSAWK
jgi:hypothetical protein